MKCLCLCHRANLTVCENCHYSHSIQIINSSPKLAIVVDK
jgi:hypothetical protein